MCLFSFFFLLPQKQLLFGENCLCVFFGRLTRGKQQIKKELLWSNSERTELLAREKKLSPHSVMADFHSATLGSKYSTDCDSSKKSFSYFLPAY